MVKEKKKRDERRKNVFRQCAPLLMMYAICHHSQHLQAKRRKRLKYVTACMRCDIFTVKEKGLRIKIWIYQFDWIKMGLLRFNISFKKNPIWTVKQKEEIFLTCLNMPNQTVSASESCNPQCQLINVLARDLNLAIVAISCSRHTPPHPWHKQRNMLSKDRWSDSSVQRLLFRNAYIPTAVAVVGPFGPWLSSGWPHRPPRLYAWNSLQCPWNCHDLK